MLLRLIQDGRAVDGKMIIATGGGAVTQPDTLSALKEQTRLCWINSPAEAIYERIKFDTKRPLLQADNPLAVLETLLAERKPLYAQAPYIVDLNDKDPYATVDEMLTLFQSKDQ